MNRIKQYLFLFFLVSFSSILLSASLLVSFQPMEDWKAPKEADNLKNPLKGNSSAISEGQKLYNNMCMICHGNKGKGDGVAGMGLNPRPTNLTTSIVQTQSDGAIFWKLTTGRAPMAAYKELLTEDQRWQLVNYIRTLKK